MTDQEAPEAWKSLRYWWIRGHRIGELGELANPVETAKWRNPDPNGPVIGIDQTFHFFFDDHQFDEGWIGICLFGRDETAAIAAVTELLERIHEDVAAPGHRESVGEDEYFLSHELWPQVESAAAAARDLLVGKGGFDQWAPYAQKAREEAAARRARNLGP